jgi:hypothetical protein
VIAVASRGPQCNSAPLTLEPLCLPLRNDGTPRANRARPGRHVRCLSLTFPLMENP